MPKGVLFASSILLLIVLSGCDCHISVEGKVFSSLTGEPIEGATIRMMGRGIAVRSNSRGQFSIGEHTGFCYDPEIVISKKGYKPFLLTIDAGFDSKSFQIHSDLRFIEYKEPLQLDSLSSIRGTWIDMYSQNFQVRGDSIFFYIDEMDVDEEIEQIKGSTRNKFQRIHDHHPSDTVPQVKPPFDGQLSL